MTITTLPAAPDTAAGDAGPDDPGRPKRPRSAVGGAFDGAIVEAGEMVQLHGRLIASAVRRPIGYWGDVRDQMAEILKLCWIPMIVSTTAFGLGAQRHTASLRHHTRTARVGTHTRIQPDTLHHEGAPRSTTSVTRHPLFSLAWSTFYLITAPSP